MTIKNQQSDDAKNEYANQLQKTNRLQQQHFEISLPDVSLKKIYMFNYYIFWTPTKNNYF